MSKAGKLVKDMLKAKKESVMGKLGDSPYEDPMEPWSAKYAQPVKEEAEQVDEGDRQALTKKLTNKMYRIDKGLGKLAKDQNRTDVDTNLKNAKSDMHKAVGKASDSDVKKMLNKEDVEQLDESDPLLFKYIRSLGYNPEQMDFASRSKYARSNAFKNYKISHMNDQLKTEEVEDINEADSYGHIMKKAKEAQKSGDLGQYHKHLANYYHQHAQEARFDSRHSGGAGSYLKNSQKSKMHSSLAADHGVNEEVEGLDEAGTGLLMSFIKAKGLNPLSMDGNQKKSYSRSSEFRIFKSRHVKEISGMGERGDDWNEEKKQVKEEADAKDVVSMDIPLLIRVLEFIREDVKTDMDLHRVVENLIDLRTQGVLTMDDYEKAVAIKAIKEEVEQIEELDTKTLDSYITKVATGPSRGMTQKGTLKSIKAIGGVTTALRKKAEKPITELKNQDDNQELDSHITREDLRKWFSKTDPEGDWKRINSKGEVAGPCAREPGEPKPKCMSKEKRAELSKSERAAAVATKRKHDPVADRAGKGGKPINVSNYGKGKLGEETVDEACWDTHKQVGTKMKGGKVVPDCVPKNEETEQIDEKNKPTNPALWSRAKSMARSKFDVYPSAYANGWASKWYKSKGGGWKSVSEDTVQEGIGGIEDSPMSATNSVKAMESEHRKKNMKSARIIKSIYKKKGKNESIYDWEKDDKPNAKVTLQGGTTMTGKPRDTVEIEPVLKTRPNSQKQ
jgi:hypothetical protein